MKARVLKNYKEFLFPMCGNKPDEEISASINDISQLNVLTTKNIKYLWGWIC